MPDEMSPEPQSEPTQASFAEAALIDPASTHGQGSRHATLPEDCGWGQILSMLLRQPGSIIGQLHEPASRLRLIGVLAGISVVCLAGYGFVAGSFSGAEQLWAAPLKIVGGSLATIAICLPSLYVLACLGGAHEKLRFGSLVGLLLAALALHGTLLVSFAPIAWVFSQSTDSIAFISSLHLVLWGVAFYFGLRLLHLAAKFLRVENSDYIFLWMVMFMLVSLQMMTTLRPIVGRSNRLLASEKQSFLTHWVELYVPPTVNQPAS